MGGEGKDLKKFRTLPRSGVISHSHRHSPETHRNLIVTNWKRVKLAQTKATPSTTQP